MIELHVKHTSGNDDSGILHAHDLLKHPDDEVEVFFEGDETWRNTRPNTLVVACSDGRLQKSIDEFLETRLGVVDYDRLYAPGGPGALGSGVGEHRTDQLRRELEFLMRAHKIEKIVLLFHGADRTGPEDAVCAHYRRILPAATRSQIIHAQHHDAADALNLVSEIAPTVKVHVFRAEVCGNGSVDFVDMRKR